MYECVCVYVCVCVCECQCACVCHHLYIKDWLMLKVMSDAIVDSGVLLLLCGIDTSSLCFNICAEQVCQRSPYCHGLAPYATGEAGGGV